MNMTKELYELVMGPLDPFSNDTEATFLLEVMDDVGELLVCIIKMPDGSVRQREISSCEFASRCKERMLSYGAGYCITSGIGFEESWFADISGRVHKQSLKGESEADVIFKACKWILEQDKGE